MILDWFTALWVYIVISVAVFVFLRIFIHKKLTNHYGWKKTDTGAELAKLGYILIAPLVLYLLWHNSQTIYWVVSKNSSKSKIGLFVNSFELKNGLKVKNNSQAEEVIVNNTEFEMIYEVVEYGTDIAIKVQEINPSEDFNSRSFNKVIAQFSTYDCSRIGIEYFFDNSPPLERGSEPALPFGNRDEEVWDLYGWLRAKDVKYTRE